MLSGKGGKSGSTPVGRRLFLGVSGSRRRRRRSCSLRGIFVRFVVTVAAYSATDRRADHSMTLANEVTADPAYGSAFEAALGTCWR